MARRMESLYLGDCGLTETGTSEMGAAFSHWVKGIIWARSLLGVHGYGPEALKAESPPFGPG